MGKIDGWSDELARLDRHYGSTLPTPDIASLAEQMRTYKVPGVSIAAGDLDSELWCAGFGSALVSESIPITSQTIFQACSISKHVAAFAALRLVDQGVLDLDTDIAGYLTSWQLPADPSGWRPCITLRQLLSHTAGLSYNWFPGYGPDDPVPTTEQTLRGELPANTPPVRASLLPGTRFRYSGSHYQVLQQLLTDVTNTPFDELMRTLVLEPVGMPDSSYRQDFPHRRPGQVAFAHDTPGPRVAGGWQTMPEMAGAGLWTTPGDLVRLDLEIIRAARDDSALLSRDSARQMLTPQVPDGMGLGTQLETAYGQQWFGHGGSNIGYRCYTMAWPELGTAVAAMANSGNATELIMSIRAAAQRYFAASAPEPDDALTSDRVTGRYLLRDDFPIDVVAGPATLSVQVPGQPSVELTPLPGGRYRFPGLDSQVWFEQEDDAIILHLHQEGETQSAPRRPG
ncbi:MAG TPA: serine hydrolase domain-containing protein [Streptosporangiaceae bacterium]|nr:serine hydrolase domain-containing protein [Streptosporangiaceae bacterium]